MSINISLPGEGGSSAELSYAYGSGPFLLSYQTLEENNWDYSWESQMNISGSISTSFGGDQAMEMTFEESPWVTTWSTTEEGDASFELVSVPAGDFDGALRLRQQADITMNLGMQGSPFSTEFTSLAHQRFVPEVGLVKTESLESGMSMDGMDFPTGFDQKSATVLVEFNGLSP